MTPGNVALYERMGFRVVAFAEMASLGVALWGLRREGPASGDSDTRDTLPTGQ